MGQSALPSETSRGMFPLAAPTKPPKPLPMHAEERRRN
jgi:hypothetical protein